MRRASTATMGKGRKKKRFTVKNDFSDLVYHSASMIREGGGEIIAVTNFRKMSMATFHTLVLDAITRAGRRGFLKYWVAPGEDFAHERTTDEKFVKTLIITVV